MYQLTYSSISTNGLNLKDLNSIPEKAKTTNFEMNISGCLIHHNQHFVQILEGNKQDVLNVFRRIQMTSVTII